MAIQFTKMHGLGNDFMVVDATRHPFYPSPKQIKQWADRHTGIGFDQLLIVEPYSSHEAEFFYRIFNADGSEANQCGNGARCIARFIAAERLSNNNPIRVATRTGYLELKIEADQQVTVNMGSPLFEPSQIPFLAPQQAFTYPIQVAAHTLTIQALSMGNPHAILTIADVQQAAVNEIGPALSSHQRFPEQANISFMQILNRQHIALRVYERGAGETLACGSAACAAVVAGRVQDLLDDLVNVKLPGGCLSVTWNRGNAPVYLTGPAEFVYQGTLLET